MLMFRHVVCDRPKFSARYTSIRSLICVQTEIFGAVTRTTLTTRNATDTWPGPVRPVQIPTAGRRVCAYTIYTRVALYAHVHTGNLL